MLFQKKLNYYIWTVQYRNNANWPSPWWWYHYGSRALTFFNPNHSIILLQYHGIKSADFLIISIIIKRTWHNPVHKPVHATNTRVKISPSRWVIPYDIHGDSVQLLITGENSLSLSKFLASGLDITHSCQYGWWIWWCFVD